MKADELEHLEELSTAAPDDPIAEAVRKMIEEFGASISQRKTALRWSSETCLIRCLDHAAELQPHHKVEAKRFRRQVLP